MVGTRLRSHSRLARVARLAIERHGIQRIVSTYSRAGFYSVANLGAARPQDQRVGQDRTGEELREKLRGATAIFFPTKILVSNCNPRHILNQRPELVLSLCPSIVMDFLNLYCRKNIPSKIVPKKEDIEAVLMAAN